LLAILIYTLFPGGCRQLILMQSIQWKSQKIIGLIPITSKSLDTLGQDSWDTTRQN